MAGVLMLLMSHVAYGFCTFSAISKAIAQNMKSLKLLCVPASGRCGGRLLGASADFRQPVRLGQPQQRLWE